MKNYITAKIIKELREKNKMTQVELANKLNVSDKTISKWETGKGLPDISLIESLAKELKVSVIELMNGKYFANNNRAGSMLKLNFYVCPICGNIIYSMGENVISCCGITLPKLEVENVDKRHEIILEKSQNEYYIHSQHEMTKTLYIIYCICYTR